MKTFVLCFGRVSISNITVNNNNNNNNNNNTRLLITGLVVEGDRCSLDYRPKSENAICVN